MRSVTPQRRCSHSRRCMEEGSQDSGIPVSNHVAPVRLQCHMRAVMPRRQCSHSRRCMEEGSQDSGILLPHRLVDELQRAATEASKPALMGGEFARLAQSCQEVCHVTATGRPVRCHVDNPGACAALTEAKSRGWPRAAYMCGMLW